MKRIGVFFTLIAILLVLVMVGFNLWYINFVNKRYTEYNITANRINNEISSALLESGIQPEEYVKQHLDLWKDSYGSSCPILVTIIPLERGQADTLYANASSNTVICAVYGGEEKICCFITYIFDNSSRDTMIIIVNLVLILCFLLIIVLFIYIYIRIIKPFQRISSYPERIAKLQIAEKLPESKSKYFGKYIWGMNMLSDTFESSRKQIHSLEYQRQTLLASLAHGVKTPVANIKLYACAIQEGLYSDGMVNETDSNIAKMIESNAVKIESLTKELLETVSTAVSDYEPDINLFYLKELLDMVKKEWSDRLRMKRIPYDMECVGNPMMSSDKWGICRVVSQLIENAVKYGDGTGIKLTMYKQDNNFMISVKNKGELLSEKELPYIFRSFWRGSNAEDKEGSGIGLYVASEIVKNLGGSFFVRRLEETNEMEFIIIL